MSSPVKLNVTVDVSLITLGDIELLSEEKSSMTSKIEVLTRICPGTDVRAIPVVQLPQLIALIDEAVESLGNQLEAESLSKEG